MERRVRTIFFFLFIFLTSQTALAGAYRLDHLPEIRKALGLDPYMIPVVQARMKDMKVAVIDNGFGDYDAKSKMLPDSVKLVSIYPDSFIKQFQLGDPAVHIDPSPTAHGTLMAQVIWGLTGYNADGPQFYLLNANGITNFRRAVRYAMQEHVDVVLYSQNWECCGNFDGSGFVDAIASDAVRSGIMWVNAAGNYHNEVFNGTISSTADDGTVSWNERPSLRVKSYFDDNPVQIVLNWSSYGSEENTGTDKDLDLYLLDEGGQVVAKSELKQVTMKEKLASGESFLPRERIQFNLARNQSGYYTIVVKAKTRNFNSSDRVRVVVIPDRPPFADSQTGKLKNSVELVDATQGQELMVPADDPDVLTVGDIGDESAVGPTEDGRTKPDIVLQSSEVSFSNGESSIGTSNAAAYVAGAALLMKAYKPDLTKEDMLSLESSKTTSSDQVDTSTPALEDTSTSASYEGKSVASYDPRTDSNSNPPAASSSMPEQGGLVQIVTQTCGERPQSSGRFSDGHYYLAIRPRPDQVFAERCGITGADAGRYEIYLRDMSRDPSWRSGNDDVICFVRAKDSPGVTPDPFPWEVDGGTSGDYVQIMNLNDVPTGNTSRPPQPIRSPEPGQEQRTVNKPSSWRAPTPDELLKK